MGGRGGHPDLLPFLGGFLLAARRAVFYTRHCVLMLRAGWEPRAATNAGRLSLCGTGCIPSVCGHCRLFLQLYSIRFPPLSAFCANVPVLRLCSLLNICRQRVTYPRCLRLSADATAFPRMALGPCCPPAHYSALYTTPLPLPSMRYCVAAGRGARAARCGRTRYPDCPCRTNLGRFWFERTRDSHTDGAAAATFMGVGGRVNRRCSGVLAGAGGCIRHPPLPECTHCAPPHHHAAPPHPTRAVAWVGGLVAG